jgi:hypothetical protein
MHPNISGHTIHKSRNSDLSARRIGWDANQSDNRTADFEVFLRCSGLEHSRNFAENRNYVSANLVAD